jgi:hypothetical protein
MLKFTPRSSSSSDSVTSGDVMLKTIKQCQRLLNKVAIGNTERLFREFGRSLGVGDGLSPSLSSSSPSSPPPPVPLRSRDITVLAAVIWQHLLVTSRRCQSAYTRKANMENLSRVITQFNALTFRGALNDALLAWLYAVRGFMPESQYLHVNAERTP